MKWGNKGRLTNFDCSVLLCISYNLTNYYLITMCYFQRDITLLRPTAISASVLEQNKILTYTGSVSGMFTK